MKKTQPVLCPAHSMREDTWECPVGMAERARHGKAAPMLSVGNCSWNKPSPESDLRLSQREKAGSLQNRLRAKQQAQK